jgi:hypothetical protein
MYDHAFVTNGFEECLQRGASVEKAWTAGSKPWLPHRRTFGRTGAGAEVGTSRPQHSEHAAYQGLHPGLREDVQNEARPHVREVAILNKRAHECVVRSDVTKVRFQLESISVFEQLKSIVPARTVIGK